MFLLFSHFFLFIYAHVSGVKTNLDSCFIKQQGVLGISSRVACVYRHLANNFPANFSPSASGCHGLGLTKPLLSFHQSGVTVALTVSLYFSASCEKSRKLMKSMVDLVTLGSNFRTAQNDTPGSMFSTSQSLFLMNTIVQSI